MYTKNGGHSRQSGQKFGNAVNRVGKFSPLLATVNSVKGVCKNLDTFLLYSKEGRGYKCLYIDIVQNPLCSSNRAHTSGGNRTRVLEYRGRRLSPNSCTVYDTCGWPLRKNRLRDRQLVHTLCAHLRRSRDAPLLLLLERVH